jgi:hypothetical protein
LGDELAKSRGKKSNLPLESGYQYIYIWWDGVTLIITYIYKYIYYIML